MFFFSALCISDSTYALADAVFFATDQAPVNMGNKPAKQEKEEIFLKVVPPLDRAYVRWLARDVERIHGYAPVNLCAVRPPDHYIEFMRLNGWLDVDLDDPEIAHLLKTR